MTEQSGPLITSPAMPASGVPPVTADRHLSELSTLLRALETVTSTGSSLPPVLSDAADNQLVQVRLGIASSLFAALRCKNAATAGHSLRVALTSSAWAAQLATPDAQRDALEIAALLHDIGMIGVPDCVLIKPGPLDADEAAVVSRARQMSLDILRSSCSSPEILAIVENVGAWYDGSRKGFSSRGQDLPLGARMITIVEAFDAMTTDHVWRPARSHERAVAELFECAGTQFDPDLVRRFADFQDSDLTMINRQVASRWLQPLDPELVNSYWQLNNVSSASGPRSAEALFQGKLLENMYDAVLFVDAGFRITSWNHGAERLTGMATGSVCHQPWHPALLKMADEKGHPIGESDCPVTGAIASGVQSLRRLTICGRTGRTVSVDTHAIPVMAEDGTILGAALLLHDASSEISLEERCQRLHEKATKDPLTQVANRAEFDRVHEMFVAAHQQQQVPCSLIICDLDRFKLVNDNYGHQAGDEAIKTLAALLKNSCRPGDLVARYGGEEFVMLCADCDNATGARRAEQIRKNLGQVTQPKMSGRSVTASFGVTEIQPGDTPETMLRRADRALLLAKSRGRNMVVQLGSGAASDAAETKTGFWSRRPARSDHIIQQVLLTPVPMKMAVEKLRGFVADHRAKIVRIEGGEVALEIEDQHPSRLRRLTDRPVAFCLDLRFAEERFQRGDESGAGQGILRTKMYVTISLRKNRDRRRTDIAQRAREVLASFRSYLMAAEIDDEETAAPPGGRLRRVTRLLAPWLPK